jgi:hypothetical protein
MLRTSSKESHRVLPIFRCTSPYAVFFTKNPDDETSNTIINGQEKFLALSESVKDKLVSEETAQKIQTIGKNFNLELLQMADIARAVRSYYFGEIQLEDFPVILSKEMQVNLEIAQKISDLVVQRIVNDDSQEKSYQAQLEKLPINVALQKYTDLGEQLITQNRIKLAVFPDLVRPSIKNWLADYTYVVGVSNRDPIVRGNYLFKNENTRNLSEKDREKLALILKSFEEKIPLTINTKIKQVLFFPEQKKLEMPQMISPKRIVNDFVSIEPKKFSEQPKRLSENIVEINDDRLSAWRRDLPPKEKLEAEFTQTIPTNIRFSSPQTFSTERSNKNVVTLEQKQLLPAVQAKNSYPQTRPLAKNVVNLKEEN